jgi:hypothetical protein
MTETLNANLEAGKRPGFLTVLCILTFIGAGLGILGGIWNLVSLPSQIESLKSIAEMTRGFGGSLSGDVQSQIDSLEKFGMASAGLSLVGSLLCLFGAIKMWKLSKNGFYIYVGGQILAIVGVFLIMGTSWLAGPLGMIFPIAFIVMYGLNLKHLK